MNHFMCDLETAGLRDNSAILSIGLVEFDETTIGRTFYCNVSLEDCVKQGLVMDPSTIMWWLGQEASARAALTTDAKQLMAALVMVNKFLALGGGPANVRLWGNGAGYDNILLKNAFKAVEADEPWKFYNNRCYRTMKALFPLENPPARVGTYHNALDDAMTQALTLQAICQKYGITLS